MQTRADTLRRIAEAIRWGDGLAEYEFSSPKDMRRVRSFLDWLRGAAITLDAMADDMEV